MIWTPDALSLLRQLSIEGLTRREAAHRLGASYNSVRHACSRYRVSFGGGMKPSDEADADLRARWNAILPRLREGLRRDLEINI